MIELSRPDGREFLLNPDLIRTIESVPETVITLTSGEKLWVREEPSLVAERALAFKRKVWISRPS